MPAFQFIKACWSHMLKSGVHTEPFPPRRACPFVKSLVIVFEMRSGFYCLLSLLLVFQQLGLSFCSFTCAREQIYPAVATHVRNPRQTMRVSCQTKAPNAGHDLDCELAKYCQVLISEKVASIDFSKSVFLAPLRFEPSIKQFIPVNEWVPWKSFTERTSFFKLPRYLYLHQILIDHIA